MPNNHYIPNIPNPGITPKSESSDLLDDKKLELDPIDKALLTTFQAKTLIAEQLISENSNDLEKLTVFLEKLFPEINLLFPPNINSLSPYGRIKLKEIIKKSKFQEFSQYVVIEKDALNELGDNKASFTTATTDKKENNSIVTIFPTPNLKKQTEKEDSKQLIQKRLVKLAYEIETLENKLAQLHELEKNINRFIHSLEGDKNYFSFQYKIDIFIDTLYKNFPLLNVQPILDILHLPDGRFHYQNTHFRDIFLNNLIDKSKKLNFSENIKKVTKELEEKKKEAKKQFKELGYSSNDFKDNNDLNTIFANELLTLGSNHLKEDQESKNSFEIASEYFRLAATFDRNKTLQNLARKILCDPLIQTPDKKENISFLYALSNPKEKCNYQKFHNYIYLFQAIDKKQDSSTDEKQVSLLTKYIYPLETIVNNYRKEPNNTTRQEELTKLLQGLKKEIPDLPQILIEKLDFKKQIELKSQAHELKQNKVINKNKDEDEKNQLTLNDDKKIPPKKQMDFTSLDNLRTILYNYSKNKSTYHNHEDPFKKEWLDKLLDKIIYLINKAGMADTETNKKMEALSNIYFLFKKMDRNNAYETLQEISNKNTLSTLNTFTPSMTASLISDKAGRGIGRFFASVKQNIYGFFGKRTYTETMSDSRIMVGELCDYIQKSIEKSASNQLNKRK